MKKLKRILALAGVIILVGLYVITLILAFNRSPGAENWLFASIGATVVIPCLLYIYMWIYRLVERLSGKKEEDDQ